MNMSMSRYVFLVRGDHKAIDIALITPENVDDVRYIYEKLDKNMFEIYFPHWDIAEGRNPGVSLKSLVTSSLMAPMDWPTECNECRESSEDRETIMISGENITLHRFRSVHTLMNEMGFRLALMGRDKIVFMALIVKG